MKCIIEFASELLDKGDLDPVYTLAAEAKFDVLETRRWLMAYWCYYRVDTASLMLDAADYWSMMAKAAANKYFERGTERRHFRGELSVSSVCYLHSRGLLSLFHPIWNKDLSLKKCMEEVQKWVGFGPWIAFKAADMLERLGISRVNFDDTAMFLFDSPKEGAKMLWEELRKTKPAPGQAESYAVKYILEHKRLKGYLAPPLMDRPLGPQEAETILCKWKSNVKGHYQIGEDVQACREQLKKLKTPTGTRLYEAGETSGLW